MNSDAIAGGEERGTSWIWPSSYYLSISLLVIIVRGYWIMNGSTKVRVHVECLDCVVRPCSDLKLWPVLGIDFDVVLAAGTQFLKFSIGESSM